MKQMLLLGWTLRQWGIAAARCGWALPTTFDDAFSNWRQYSALHGKPAEVELAGVRYAADHEYVKRLIEVCPPGLPA